MADGVGYVFARHYRLRHPGEPRELIHHAPYVVDLTNDRVGALLEDGPILAELPKALGASKSPSAAPLILGQLKSTDAGVSRGVVFRPASADCAPTTIPRTDNVRIKARMALAYAEVYRRFRF